MIGAMTTRRGLFVAPFDSLADPRVVGDLAATAEAAGHSRRPKGSVPSL